MRAVVFGGREFGVPKKAYLSEKEREFDLENRVKPQRKLFMETMIELMNFYTWPYDPCGKSAKPYLEIISGMAPGADTLAVEFAKHFKLKLHEFPADWHKYKKGAGSIRNQQMIDQGKPQLGVAFPGSTGTADMTNRLKFEGITVREIPDVIRSNQM